MAGVKLEDFRIPLDDIKAGTDNFSAENYIGGGGFGKVYKGELSVSGSHTTAAIKRLDPKSLQGKHEFLNEISMLFSYRHENIINFIGYCDEGNEMIVVYEYAINQSLDKYLRDSDKISTMSWEQRLKICIGAARGLDYLHSGLGEHHRVIHRDIKSANILLDENWVAKISDFGLSKIGPKDLPYTDLHTRVAGTLGYCDPNYYGTEVLKKESDVYSFGVVLFEMLCGRLVFKKRGNEDDEPESLVEWVRCCYKDGEDKIIDPVIRDRIQSKSLSAFMEIAYRCIKINVKKRPTMAAIVEKLEEALEFQFNDLQDCYLQKRRYWARPAQKQEEKDGSPVQREGYHAGLKEFQSVLSAFTSYSRLRVIAELRQGDSADIVSSIEFDRDDELFATADISQRIKVFEFASVVNEQADVQYPIAEMSTRSKLSCLSWNNYTQNQIASSDYEGIVTVWDVTTCQSVLEYKEHEKRAWSVDFSRTEPTMLVSGSDDCKVKIWCTKQEASVLNIDMKSKICSVKYNPGSSFHLAVGSADHRIHYYDLRNISQPLHIFRGHRKSVSYVKFLSNFELASASTDSTLRLWNVKANTPLCMFRGHINLKNFVGLDVNSEYLACGCETNEVFVYHKAFSRPVAWHRFSSDTEGEEKHWSCFTSAVCWKGDSPTMLTANSQGTIKVLELAA